MNHKFCFIIIYFSKKIKKWNYFNALKFHHLRMTTVGIDTSAPSSIVSPLTSTSINFLCFPNSTLLILVINSTISVPSLIY